MPDSQSFFGPSFFATLTGATISFLATFLAQQRTFKNAADARSRERKTTERKEAEKRSEQESVLALSMMTKLNQAVSNMADIHNHLHDAFILSIKIRSEFSGCVKAFSTDPEKFDFTNEEFVLVRDLRKADLLTDLMDVPRTHALYVDNMSLFRSMRRDIETLAEIEAVRDDGHATFSFEGQAALRARMKIKELNDLLMLLWARSWSDLCRTNNIMLDLQDALRNRLGKEYLKVQFELLRMPDQPPIQRGRRGLLRPATPKRT